MGVVSLVRFKFNVSEIGAVAKVADTNLCWWGSTSGKKLQFSYSIFTQGLITFVGLFASFTCNS